MGLRRKILFAFMLGSAGLAAVCGARAAMVKPPVVDPGRAPDLPAVATDRLAMAGGATIHVEVDVAAIDERLAALEQAAAAATLSPAQAVIVALEWEEAEVTRITTLLAALPDTVRARVRAGVLGEIDTHYADLRALLASAGRRDLEGRVDALRTAAIP